MMPLEGIRVIEVGTVLMAPYAAQWLADMGADVIKVEPPGGDQTRLTGPSVEAGMAAMFVALNRSKRSIMIDLGSAKGRDELEQLLGSADVLLHNIRPQKLAKLGLDPADTTRRHPRLVYAGLCGFGSNGRYHGRPAYDDIIQGMTGVADLVDRQTGSPRYAPMALADKICGIVAAMSICAALTRRAQSGQGCIVEVPMFETMAAFTMAEHFSGAHFPGEAATMGYGRTLSRSRGPHRTSDGTISLMPYTDRQWRTFFAFAGLEEAACDPRFADMRARTENIDALHEILADAIRSRPSREWLSFAEAAEIPAGPVLTLEDLLEDPHLSESGFFSMAEDELMGQLRFPGMPVTFDNQRSEVRVPPRLDQHRGEVLIELDEAPPNSRLACG